MSECDRAAFEIYAKRDGLDIGRVPTESAPYRVGLVDVLWRYWQAAKASTKENQQ